MRFYGRNVRWKKRVDTKRLLKRAVGLIIGLWVLNFLVNTLDGIVHFNNTSSMFYVVYQFLGVISGTTGILAIAGVLLAVNLLNEVLEVN